MECSEVDVLVIGAGPTGLGAAKRLNQLVRLWELLLHYSETWQQLYRTAQHGWSLIPTRLLVVLLLQMWRPKDSYVSSINWTFSCPADKTSLISLPAVRCRRPRYFLSLQILWRLHRWSTSQGGRLVYPPAHLVRSLQESMGAVPFPEQHLHVAKGRTSQVHGWNDRCCYWGSRCRQQAQDFWRVDCTYDGHWYCGPVHAAIQF